MKTLVAAAFIVGLAGLSSAQAMPVAPAPADANVTKIAQGCGPGFHRGPRGHCRPNAVFRGCGPGWHRDRHGRCRPNR